MKYWFLLGALMFGVKISEFVGARRAQTYYQDLLHQDITPSNSVIVFDWHKVVQEQNFSRIGLKLIMRTNNLSSYALKPQLWAKMRELVALRIVTEKIIDRLNDDYPGLTKVKQEFMAAVNEEPLISETVQLLQYLKNQGYTLYMLSNIAPETLEGLWKKHQPILELFNGIYVPNEAHNYLQKPHPQFYQGFKDFVTAKGDAGKTMLFIDDREKNVQAGYTAGMYGIVFSSPAQLKEIFKKLKILEIEA